MTHGAARRAPAGLRDGAARRLQLVLAIVLTLGAILGATAAAASGQLDPVGRRSVTLGHSVEGRPITAIESGDFDSPLRALIVGCVHGDECAGVSVTDQFALAPPPAELDLWVVPDLNPDGAAKGTRGNAHGVDLNRNFPWRWTPLVGLHYSGRYPLSEPESRLAWALEANGQRTDWFVPGAMDAQNWPLVARAAGLRVGRRPTVGAIAVWPDVAPPFGHVAYVTGVHGSMYFDVAEYNLPVALGGSKFGFDTRHGLTADGEVLFIHVPRRSSQPAQRAA